MRRAVTFKRLDKLLRHCPQAVPNSHMSQGCKETVLALIRGTNGEKGCQAYSPFNIPECVTFWRACILPTPQKTHKITALTLSFSAVTRWRSLCRVARHEHKPISHYPYSSVFTTIFSFPLPNLGLKRVIY